MIRALLLTLFLLSPAVYAQEKIEEQWYTLILQGTPVGTVHQTTWKTGQGTYRSELEQTMSVSRFGVPFSISRSDIWIEDERFAVIGLTSKLDMNGQLQTVQVRSPEGDLEIVLQRGEQTETIYLPGAQRVTGLYGAARMVSRAVARGTAAAGSELSYRLFSPETLKIEEVRVQILGSGEMEDSMGRRHRGIVVEERSSALPGVVTTEVYSEAGQFLYSRTPVGLAVEIVRAPAGAAGAGTARLFDVAALGLTVRGLQRLPGPVGRLQSITVRFTGQAVALLEEAIRASWRDLGGNGQSVVRIRSYAEPSRAAGPGRLVVELRRASFLQSWQKAGTGRDDADSTPGGREGELSRSNGALEQDAADYLGGGFHLNLDDPRLTGLLSPCLPRPAGNNAGDDAGDPTRLAERMACLETRVHEFIENKSLAYGFAGVSEILDSRTGDCTEHALLLVALLRKMEIPSRMAYGLILTEAGFIGHAWSEAFLDGRWHWLDPSFPGAGPYGHKIRLGLLDPAEPAWAQMGLTLLRVGSEAQAEILGGSLAVREDRK